MLSFSVITFKFMGVISFLDTSTGVKKDKWLIYVQTKHETYRINGFSGD